jgi:DNA-binding NarL/FixJ family response regulator
MMVTQTDHESRVTTFVADNCRMGTQLMTTALQGSRYGIEVVGSGITSDEVRTGLRRFQARVALVSAHLKDGPTAGFEVTREIRLRFPKTDVIVLLDVADPDRVSECFRAGAVGILSRDEPFAVVCKSIYTVAQGQVWANSQQLRIAVETLSRTAPGAPSNPDAPDMSRLLTKREESLAFLVAEGCTNRDISRQLNLSEHTVRNYLFRIFNKLGTANRLELALYVINRREAGHSSKAS